MSKMKKAPKSLTELSNIIAIALAVVSVLLIFMPLTVLNGNDMGAKWLGAITANASGIVGITSIIVRFGFIGLMLASAALAVIYVLNPKKAKQFLPLAILLFTIGCGAFSLMTIAFSLAVKTFAIDAFTFVFSIAGLVLYCLKIAPKFGDYFIDNLCQFALTLAFSILAILACGTYLADKNFAFVALILSVLVGANLVYGCLCLNKEADLKIERIRCMATIGVGVVVFLFTLLADSTISGILLALLAIAFTLCQFEFINNRAKRYKKNPVTLNLEEAEEVEEVEEIVEAPVAEEETAPVEQEPTETEITPPEGELPFGKPLPYPMTTEADIMENNNEKRTQYAEARPYLGGPVSGVEMAQEVNPTVNPEAATAEYDYYNCRSFDPFIATLDAQERNQFTELFILKYKGVMPEIPDYVVGGDNREFFNKIFIYLGQYRDRIPSGLLNKIYNFSVKL